MMLVPCTYFSELSSLRNAHVHNERHINISFTSPQCYNLKHCLGILAWHNLIRIMAFLSSTSIESDNRHQVISLDLFHCMWYHIINSDSTATWIFFVNHCQGYVASKSSTPTTIFILDLTNDYEVCYHLYQISLQQPLSSIPTMSWLTSLPDC